MRVPASAVARAFVQVLASAAGAIALLGGAAAAQTAQPVPAPAPAAAARDALAQRLTTELQQRVGALAPGVQAAVSLRDATLLPLAIGVADRDARTPMPHDGKLLAGSTGKTFFAALACQLVEEQKLDLDRKVATWFTGDDAAWFARLPNAKDVTVRHLLMHRSGIMRYEFDPAFTARLTAEPDHRFTPREELAFVLDKAPRFAAGAGFDYSDSNYVLLGLVLEQVAGAPCYQEIERRFLRPLQLTNTVPGVGRRIPGLLPSYAGPGNPFGGRDAMLVAGELPFDPAFEGAGGGFATTASDLARWARALYARGGVLGALREQAVAGEVAPLGRGTRYGLGVIVDATAHGPAWGHRGFFPGSVSEMRYYPELDVAVALLANSSAERRLPRALGETADALAGIAAGR